MKLGFPDEQVVRMGAFDDVYYALPEEGLIVFIWKTYSPLGILATNKKYSVLLTEHDSDLLKTADRELLPAVFHALARGFRKVDLRVDAEDELTAQVAIHHLLDRYHAGYNKYGARRSWPPLMR